MGTSLFVVMLQSFAGASGYAQHVAIDWSPPATISAMAIAGTFAGAHLAGTIQPNSLRRGFAYFAYAMAVVLAFKSVPDVTIQSILAPLWGA